MAVAQAGTTAFASANTATITSASFTPTANSLVVAMVAMGNGTGGASSLGTLVDSSGGTWTRKSGDSVSGSGVAEVWIKDAGASPVAQTVTYDPGGTGASGLVICVRWYTGAKAVASQTGATAVNGGTTSYATTVTPTNVGSIVCGSFARASDAQTLTATGATTSIGQVNGASGDTAGLYTSSVTTTVAALSLGYSNAAAGINRQANVEIIPTAASATAAQPAAAGVANPAVASIGAQAGQPTAAGSALDATTTRVDGTFSRLQTFDAGTATTAITAANSATSGDALTAVALGGDGSATYISDSYRGGMSGRFQSGASGAIVYGEQATGVASQGQLFVRLRFRMPVIPPDTTGIRFVVVADGTGAFQVEGRLSSTGKVQLRTGAGVVVNNSTATYVANQWIDVAVAILAFSATVGVIELKLYDSAGGVAETITSAASVDSLRNGGFTKVQAGMIRTGITTYAVDVDDLAVSNSTYPSPPVATAGTSPPAEATTGVGTAGDATVAISPNAEVATAAGVASDASVASLANGGVATGVGQALDAVASLVANSEVATGSGAALDAVASATVSAEVASSAATAWPASSAVSANAESATGTGQASDATVSTASATNAPAESPSGVGTALDGAPSIAVNPPTPEALGAALDALSSLSSLPPTPSGTGDAQDASVALLASAETASAAGSAGDATVSSAASASAPAEAAQSAGAALDASASTSAGATAAVAAGSALDATVAIGVAAEVATAVGQAWDLVASILANSEVATSSGTGQDATVATSSSVSAPAEVATATGSASDATVATSVPAGVAISSGSAGDGQASVTTAAEAASGSGSAGDATVVTVISVQALAEVATGSGSAGNASATVSVFAEAASASGAATGTAASIGTLAESALGSGSALASVASVGAVAGLAEGVGEALDLDTSGGTSSPTGWVISTSQAGRILPSVTTGVLVSQTHRGTSTVARSDVLVSTTHESGE